MGSRLVSLKARLDVGLGAAGACVLRAWVSHREPLFLIPSGENWAQCCWIFSLKKKKGGDRNMDFLMLKTILKIEKAL